MEYGTLKLLVGVLATIGLYSVLYKENKFYRFVEHVFLGLASGFTIISYWKETVRTDFYDQFAGVPGAPAAGLTPATVGSPGFWLYGALIPVGLMGYMAYTKRHAWMSRIPIMIIIGLWAGQQVKAFQTTQYPQLLDTMQPIFPTGRGSLVVPAKAGLSPEQLQDMGQLVYPSQALNNLILLVTFCSVLSYFFFSFELKSKFMLVTNKLGRYILMVGLGAIFGSTVLMRFTLVIDRMFFIFIEFLKQTVFGMR
ncbi:MAG: hypothetical protein K8R88_11815 [Armatimonadetes bacterium]|nr:hypothetical protein [Armatimonadota bacterium]